MTPYEHLKQRYTAGEVIVIDGGMGSTIEEYGVEMDPAAWSALANLDHESVVRRAHEDFIRSGTDVLIVNTFSAARPVLTAAGRGDQVAESNQRAVRAAREARDAVATTPVAVLGSISSYPASSKLAARLPAYDVPTPSELQDIYREQVDAQLEAGIDALVLEMMNGKSYALAALEVGLRSGVPLWLGVSPVDRGGPELEVVGDGTEGVATLDDMLRTLIRPEIDVLALMHCKCSVVPGALEIARRHWRGPIAVYPEVGTWDPPHWQDVDMDPEAFAAEGRGWVATGVTIVGGCCGVGPKHIKALKHAVTNIEQERTAT